LEIHLVRNKGENSYSIEHNSGGVVIFLLCGTGLDMLKLHYIHSNAWDGD